MSADPKQRTSGVAQEEARARLLDVRRVLVGLERRNRLLRAVLAIGVLMLIVGGVRAAGGPEGGTVRARKFVVKDAGGRCRAELSTTMCKFGKKVSYSPRLVLYGTDGQPRAVAALHKRVWSSGGGHGGESELTFTDAGGDRRVAIVHDTPESRDDARITLFKRNKSACSFGVNSQHSSYVGMNGADGHSSLRATIRGNTKMHYLSMIKTTAASKSSVSLHTYPETALKLLHRRPRWGRITVGISSPGQENPGSGYISVGDYLEHARKTSAH